MEPDLKNEVAAQAEKIDQILASVKKTERYQKISLWITIVVFVLPLLAAIIVVPIAINSYLDTLNGLL